MYQFKTLFFLIILFLLNLIFVCKIYAIEKKDLQIEKLHDFEYPWGMDLIDENNLLISEKKGILKIYNFSNNKILQKETLKDVYLNRQGGLLDVIFVENKNNQYVFYDCD